MEKKETINKFAPPPKRAILESIINASRRIIERENHCFKRREVRVNFSALARGLLKKYEELITYYPKNSSSSEFLQELKKKMENIQHLKNPHKNVEFVSYLSELLLSKEEELTNGIY